jgi:Protein of unknown function (DUF1524)
VVTVVLACGVLALAGCQPRAISNGSGSAGGSGAGASGSAAAALAKLRVKADGSMSTYDRIKDFGPAWTDSTGAPGGHNHCDTRDDILDRDLTGIHLTGRCTVSSGTLKDPYTGRSIPFKRGRSTSSAVQIDHLVPLGNAWITGASGLSPAMRKELANDPLNLVAADGPANMGKGDDDASEWLPKQTGYDCEYVARQIAVKTKYGLWVDSNEKSAMQRVLNGCHGQALPSESSHEVELKSS